MRLGSTRAQLWGLQAARHCLCKELTGISWQAQQHTAHHPLRCCSKLEGAVKRYSRQPSAQAKQTLPHTNRKGMSGCPTQVREDNRSRAARSLFRIAGVTFEGRQERLALLEEDGAGQAVMLVKEPENEFDPNAVAVKLLDGSPLGYVPRDQTSHFARSCCFGHLKSVGRANGTGPLGAVVEVQSTLEPLVAEAIPPALEEYCKDIEQYIDPLYWTLLCGPALANAQERCTISGALCPELVVAPVWEANPHKKHMVFTGVCCIAPELHVAQQLLLQDPVEQEAVWVFQAMNGWIPEEAQAYRRHQQQLRQKRSKEDWRLKLRCLEQLGVPTPDALQPVSI